ncbi:MAG: DUF1572 domain-containing protein [Gemmatimonadales bacterium]|nr:MAG: DUF1572 domain-containing protein [Gemmatimonadales bacterium]
MLWHCGRHGARVSGPVLGELVAAFRVYKRLGERALEQVNDRDFVRVLDEDSNSLAILVQHMAGNLRSRFTDFLVTDGEKPDRNRDLEFELSPETSRVELIQRWEAGWEALFGALEPLRAEDLDLIVLIRGQRQTVLKAIVRQLSHHAYHVGQIVQLSRHWAGPEWKTLSIPRGGSEAFNAEMAVRFAEPVTSQSPPV